MENQEQEQKQPELNITDLQNLKTLVDVAVRRGTFQTNELSSVGSVVDRLNNFLAMVAAQQPATQPNEEATEPQSN